MLVQLMNRPCVIRQISQGSTTDDYGNDEPVVTELETTCDIQQASRTEEETDSPARGRWDGFFPPQTDLRSGDSVEVEGDATYEVIGDPWQAWNPRAMAYSHVEATLDLTRGGYEPS